MHGVRKQTERVVPERARRPLAVEVRRTVAAVRATWAASRAAKLQERAA